MPWIKLDNDVYGESLDTSLKNICSTEELQRKIEEKTIQITMLNSEISEINIMKSKIQKEIDEIILIIGE